MLSIEQAEKVFDELISSINTRKFPPWEDRNTEVLRPPEIVVDAKGNKYYPNNQTKLSRAMAERKNR